MPKSHHCEVGFTPAHAGNTSCIMYLSICQPGSPPLTRGIRAILYMSFILMRFTPAHAGNTYSAMIKKEAQWVHPRSRGEYIRYPCPAAWIRGSPPLTRGIRQSLAYTVPACRFTPAHAGNTSRKSRRNEECKVHPRSRGEYLKGDKIQGDRKGSPPLTRGIPFPEFKWIDGTGFTPAHAGNTIFQP